MAKHILIVDDEPKVGYFLKETLESLGPDYTVASVTSAEDALTALARAPFDLMVTDLRMPGLNGLELIGRARRDQPRLPAILITAFGSDDVAAAARRLQAAYYFTKPFPIEAFLKAVQDSLEPPRLPDSRQLEPLAERLQDLRLEVGAQGAMLARLQGEVLAEVGVFEGLEREPLLAVLGQSLAAGQTISTLLREDRSFNVIYHEGTRFDVYAVNLDADLFIGLVFDRRLGLNRVGVVWLYLKRAAQEMQSILARADDNLPSVSSWDAPINR